MKRNVEIKKSKVVILLAGLLLLVVGGLLSVLALIHASHRTESQVSAPISHTSSTSDRLRLLQENKGTTTRQGIQIKLVLAPRPTVASAARVAAPSAKVATSPATATPVATQPAAIPLPSSASSDRSYPVSTPTATMKVEAATLTKQQVKTLIESQVTKNWSVIQSTLRFSSEAKAYAFFLGFATRESTLNAALETGNGPSHSYGALQAAETAYANANPSYAPENDVPAMVQYAFTPQNFYDPGIAIHMGIRHLLHFADLAQAAGYSGTELLRHTLIGYNTGVVTDSNQSWLQAYSDEIGAIAGWYLNNAHLYDSQFTWTGSAAVDRSSPWSWY